MTAVGCMMYYCIKLNSKSIINTKYINYTGDNINSVILDTFNSMPINSVEFLTLRAYESGDAENPLNHENWIIFIFRYGVEFGFFEARTYNSYKIYRANYQNGTIGSWEQL